MAIFHTSSFAPQSLSSDCGTAFAGTICGARVPYVPPHSDGESRYVYLIDVAGFALASAGTSDLCIDAIARKEICNLGYSAEIAEEIFDAVDIDSVAEAFDVQHVWSVQGIAARAASRAGFGGVWAGDEQGDVLLVDTTAARAPALHLVELIEIFDEDGDFDYISVRRDGVEFDKIWCEECDFGGLIKGTC